MERDCTNRGREIIGFDLGHGESALVVAMAASNEPPKPLKMHDQTSFVTAVAEHPRRGVIIGEDALTARDGEGLRIGFKSPELDDPDVYMPIRQFVRKILDTLVGAHEISGGEDSHFIVGHPSGWSEPIREQYKSLLHGAGLLQLTLVPESRAAFIYAREDGALSVHQDQLAGSVLIIDIGSSTTDFTAVSEFRAAALDFGDVRLGAGLIDKVIFERTLASHECAMELKEIFGIPNWRAKCEIACRKTKEMYFSNPSMYVDDPVYQIVRTGERGIHFEPKLTEREMAHVLKCPLPQLSGRTWPGAFQEALCNARDRMEQEARPPDLVLLTGGGSRMGFVLSLCEQVFPGVTVKRGAEPELAIARGLAWAGRIDRKTQAFRGEVDDLFNSGRIEQIVERTLPALIGGVADALIAILPDRFVLPGFREWQSGGVGTLAELETTLQQRVQDWLQSADGRQALIPAIAEWFNAQRPEIEQLTEPVCDSYGIPRAALSLPPTDPIGGSLPPDAFDPRTLLGLDEYAAMTSVIISMVLGVLLAAHIGTAIALHVLGFLVIVVTSIVALAVGYQAAVEWVKGWHFPVPLRKLVRESMIREKLEDREKIAELKRSLSGSLQSKPEQTADATRKISEALRQQLLVAAEKAELLIR